MKIRYTLKTSFIIFLAILALLSLLVLSALHKLTLSIDTLKTTEEHRYQATVLASGYKELAQAMTRNVMAFVASEQPEFETNYKHLSAILHGQAPDAKGIQKAMRDRFSSDHYSSGEMALLQSAHEQLLALAQTEVEAISTASGQFDDGQGGIKVALPNALMAKVMIFGQQYADAAAGIAGTIDEFDTMQATRYNSQVEQASQASASAYRNAVTAISLLLLCSAVALWRLYRSVKRPLDQGVHLAKLLADGYLDARITVQRRDELGDLLLALNGIGEGLQRAVHEVRSGASYIATASHRISDGNRDLSERSDEQAASLQRTSAALEQFAITVQQNADSAQQTKDLIAQADAFARHGSNTMQEAVHSMHKIRQDSSKVADITGVIKSIAFQTNILALNAAIEAARAGVHGRGFAVVAAEVRSLAQRSAQASIDIEKLIALSVTQLDSGAALVEGSGKAMEDIVLSIHKVQDIMNEVVEASREQASGIKDVTLAIGRLDHMTQANLAIVRTASSATQTQRQQANDLLLALARFTLPEPEPVLA